MGSCDEECLINLVTSSVEGASLLWLTDAHIFGVLPAIKLDERRSVAAVEAWMLSIAKQVVFVDD